MTVRVQRVQFSTERSWTVVDESLEPVEVIERFLAHQRNVGASPHTLRAYATALAQWWNYLTATQRPWDRFDEADVRGFIRHLQTGDEPGTPRIGETPPARTPATVNARMGALQAFYLHASSHGITEPAAVLAGPARRRRSSSYVPFLDGIANGSGVTRTRRFKVSETSRLRTPVLTAQQITTILNSCSTPGGDGKWSGGLAGLRDRLLFAILAETGIRIGEALSLRHKDIVVGQGSHPYLHVIPRQDHPHGERVKRREVSEIVISDEVEQLYSTYVWELFEAGIDITVADVNDWFVFVNVAAEPLFQPMRVESVYRRVRQISTHNPSLPPDWTPHWLRHTHATALLLAGTPFHVVQRRLGHADIQTTLNTYGWVDAEAEMHALTQWKSYAAEVPQQ